MTKFKSFCSSKVKAALFKDGVETRTGSAASTATSISDIESVASTLSLSSATNLAQNLAYYEVTKKQQNLFNSSRTYSDTASASYETTDTTTSSSSTSSTNESVTYETTNTTVTSPITANPNWITTSISLRYNNGVNIYDVKLAGFSLTHTENYAGFNSFYLSGPQEDSDCIVYFNYYNNYIYSNLVNVANIIYGSTNTNYNSFNSLSSTSMNNIPAVRIPLNADYWLNGSGPSSIINTDGGNMTSTQYQNMIISMVYYLMNPITGTTIEFTGTGNGCVIILDLHWNYSNNNNESGSYTSPNETAPGQCAMAVANNSIAFWNSISSVFGVDSSGNELSSTSGTINLSSNTTTINQGSTYTLTSTMKNNIFFELYNEPYLDLINVNIGTSTSPIYESYSDYDNNFNLYIQGSEYSTGNAIQDPANGDCVYNTVGMGTLYNNIRVTNNCYNVVILGGAEEYAYFAGSNYIVLGNGSTTPNNFIYDSYGSGTSCYNCWTKLNNAIISGTIPMMNTDGSLSNSIYSNNSNGLVSVLANIHPYSNRYYKFPGYMYNTTNNNTAYSPNNGDNTPCFSNFLQALQNGTNPSYTSVTPPSSSGIETCSGFQISFPIISTEFGMYNLPWINSSGITYTTMYNENPAQASQGTADDWTGIETTIGSYNYWGQYYDENGNPTYSPFIIGCFETFNTFNISYTIWALVPNVNAFDQNTQLQVNYSISGQNTTSLPLLQDSDININTTTPGQNAFDMNFCFQKYYLNTSGAITE